MSNIKNWTYGFTHGILLLLFLQIPNHAFASALIFMEKTPDSIYLLLSLGWLVIIAFLYRHYKRSDTKFRQQLSKLNQNIEQQKSRLDFIRLHTDQLKKERIQKLHEELGQMDAGLKAMEQTLQASYQASKRNSILLSNISHTLRTNLNDILGFSALMATEFAMNEEEELFSYSENIRKSGESLLHLLNNIIDISRIEAKTFNLKPENCELTTITKEIIGAYENQAKQKGIKIVYESNEVPVFAGDGESLRHILSNLIDNAIRYTEEGFIKIQQRQDNQQIIWTIKDTGIGIDKVYLPDIFEPFRRHSLGYSKTTYQGAGLGLPLVKQLLELMGGSIELESQKAVGTTVTIFLPYHSALDEKETEVPKETLKRKATLKPQIDLVKPLHRLLVIDDDKMNNMLIRKMLPETKQLDFATHKKELIRNIETSIGQHQLYEAFILDTNFENPKGGLRWLTKIPRTFPEYTDTPIIALSSFPELDEEEDHLIKMGFCAYLAKPLNKARLISSLNRCLRS